MSRDASPEQGSEELAIACEQAHQITNAWTRPFAYSSDLTPLQNELIERHYYLPPHVARTIVRDHSQEELEIATADGYLGLVIAATRNYDSTKRDVRTTTGSGYFVESIRGEILRGMRERYGRYTEKLNPDGTTALSAHGVTLWTEKITKRNLSVQNNTAHSFDEPVVGSGNDVLLFGDVLISKQAELELDDLIADLDLKTAIASLAPRSRKAIYARFELGMTQQEIAGQLGVSQMHVSRILRAAGKHIREELDKAA